MKIKGTCCRWAAVLLLVLGTEFVSGQTLLHQGFGQYEKMGRGVCQLSGNVLTTREAYAAWGSRDWSNYEIRFRARTPAGGEQVQIWAGFREYDRNDRYIFCTAMVIYQVFVSA